MEVWIKLATVLRIVVFLTAAHIALTSIEQLATIQRFGPDGIMSWNIYKQILPDSRYVERIFRYFSQYSRFRWVLIFRFVGSVLLGLAATMGKISSLLLLVTLVTSIAVSLRHQGGLSGDYHMSLLILFSLFIASLFPTDSIIMTISLLFIAVQLTLSYVVAGVAKLVSSDWRSGTALVDVMSTQTWGHGPLYERLRDHPTIAQASAWSVISFEVLFPIVFFVPIEWAFVLLFVGFMFHLSNAVFMGLNGFLIAFPAAYPSVIYINQLL